MTSEKGTPSEKDNGLKMKRIAETLSRLSLAGSLCIGGLLLSACASEETTDEEFEGSAGGYEELGMEDIDYSKRKPIFGYKNRLPMKVKSRRPTFGTQLNWH